MWKFLKFFVLFHIKKHLVIKYDFVYLDKSDSTAPLTSLESFVKINIWIRRNRKISLEQENYKAYLNLTSVSATRLIVFK